MQSTRWCFTLNNPTAEECEFIRNGASTAQSQFRYLIFGRETGDSGTPHLQGFAIFNNAKRLRAVKLLLSPRVHAERARGTSAQARDYCKKDGDYEEHGDFPAQAGQRNDLEAIIQWADDFEREHGRPAESPDVAVHQPVAFIRYPRFTRALQYRAQRQLFETTTEDQLRAWQRELGEKLKEPADDRKIMFYIDINGGTGKTFFCRWLISQQEDVQVLSAGRQQDLAHAVLLSTKIFLINVPRSGMEFLSYRFIEGLKDRLVWSPKYNSTMKKLRSKVHVVVFSNEAPNMAAMSADRYVIKHLLNI